MSLLWKTKEHTEEFKKKCKKYYEWVKYNLMLRNLFLQVGLAGDKARLQNMKTVDLMRSNKEAANTIAGEIIPRILDAIEQKVILHMIIVIKKSKTICYITAHSI